MKKKIQTIEEKNAQFEALSPACKRAAIALDTLEWLDKDVKITATPGTYFRIAHPVGVTGDKRSIINLLQQPRASCEVCAIGAAFISWARLTGKGEVPEYGGDSILTERHTSVGRYSAVAQLGEFFPNDMLREMECVFESKRRSGDGGWSYNATECLREIMENIIRNDGSFNMCDTPDSRRNSTANLEKRA